MLASPFRDNPQTTSCSFAWKMRYSHVIYAWHRMIRDPSTLQCPHFPRVSGAFSHGGMSNLLWQAWMHTGVKHQKMEESKILYQSTYNVCVYIYIYAYIYIYRYIYICIHICIGIYIYICIHTYIYIGIYIYTYIYTYMYIGTYIHIYIYTHTNTHTHIYIYICARACVYIYIYIELET